MSVQSTIDFNPSDIGLEARACVWMLESFEDCSVQQILFPVMQLPM
jgi:hypothetical protein